MTIEDKLIQGLIDSYKAKGINLQRILDNPLFQALPLDKKVKIIESEAIKFPAPKIGYKPMLEGAGIGAISAISGLGMAGLSSATKYMPSSGAVTLAGAIGAILGASLPTLAIYKNYSRDKYTHENTSDGLNSLINRSMGFNAPLPPSFNLPGVIHGLEGKAVGLIHKIDTTKI